MRIVLHRHDAEQYEISRLIVLIAVPTQLQLGGMLLDPPIVQGKAALSIAARNPPDRNRPPSVDWRGGKQASKARVTEAGNLPLRISVGAFCPTLQP